MLLLAARRRMQLFEMSEYVGVLWRSLPIFADVMFRSDGLEEKTLRSHMCATHSNADECFATLVSVCGCVLKIVCSA